MKIQTSARLTGLTAAQFNTPSATAAFQQAIETAIDDPSVTVTDIQATDVTQRRLQLARRLQAPSSIDVSYTLVKELDDNQQPAAAFEEVLYRNNMQYISRL